MSLLDALLLDPLRMNIWIAARTDGIAGTGTQNDPFNGSVRSTLIFSVTSLSSFGTTTATATSNNHGFHNGDLVLIAGATGADANLYNGTFFVTNVTTNTFQYTMSGTPQSSPATGPITCQLNPYLFDAVMRALPIDVTAITHSGTTATVTAINHNFAVGITVMIDGADQSAYNGTFSIFKVTANGFQYTMNSTPATDATGVISCRLNQAGIVNVPPPLKPPFAVLLGPGTFQTGGYSDSVSGGWQPARGMKIHGSGVDVTTLQLAGSGLSAHFYAICHMVSPDGSAGLVDYFEVSDLTIDCNLGAFSGTSAACGAVRVMGNHAKVRHLKVINWGTKAVSRPCFVVSVLTASDVASVEACGIEECIAVSPATGNAGPATAFHVGGREQAGVGWQQTGMVSPVDPLAYGVGPSIRNCFVDGGQTSPGTPEMRGFSMAWCKAGVIEGNQAHNLMYGVFQQPTDAKDLVIRNNWFKNVNKGVFLGSEAPIGGAAALALQTAPFALVTVNNYLQSGDFAQMTGSGTVYDGLVVQVVSPTGTNFQFKTSITTPSSANFTAVNKVSGVGTLIIEGNVVELVTATSGSIGDYIGIHVKDWWAAANPKQDANYPAYPFGTVIVRDNKIRYVDGQFMSSFLGYPIQINGAMDLLVRNNVVESAPAPATAQPIQNARCGAVVYFNNLTPAGVLVQGWNDDNSTSYEELSTITDFALVMGLFNKKG